MKKFRLLITAVNLVWYYSSLSVLLKIVFRVSEMAEQLRALGVFIENPSSVPSTHKAFVTLVSGNLIPSSGLHNYCMRVGSTHIKYK